MLAPAQCCDQLAHAFGHRTDRPVHIPSVVADEDAIGDCAKLWKRPLFKFKTMFFPWNIE